ncbi:MAG: hypothetical protein HY696_01085 [Deltaproteobacteria bacterium]|nr:hypothetical protein [Deltaproteobacteria bacterium]
MTTPSKNTWMQIRVDPQQKTAIRALAKRAGMDMSAWVLSQLLPPRPQQWSQRLRALETAADARFALAAINDYLTALPASAFASALATAQPRGVSPYLANYVAAMVECAAHRCGVVPPPWVADIAPLAQPVFGTDLLSVRPLLLVSAPPPFRNRNIFIDATIGDRV